MSNSCDLVNRGARGGQASRPLRHRAQTREKLLRYPHDVTHLRNAVA
jgi:hypothetical protein